MMNKIMKEKDQEMDLCKNKQKTQKHNICLKHMGIKMNIK